MSDDEQTPFTARHQNDPRADQPCQPTRTPVPDLHQQAVAVTNTVKHSRLKSGPPLMRRICIPVSGIKLMLGLRVGFISSHLTADKLFPVNPRVNTGPPKMSLLHEAIGYELWQVTIIGMELWYDHLNNEPAVCSYTKLRLARS